MSEPGYVDRPPTVSLYHYTSLSGLMGIVENKKLWATHVSYMNDASELRHATSLLASRIRELSSAASEPRLRALVQLNEWLQHGFLYDHLLFACSFTTNGNLLSQWRAYCPPGKGVSLGFDPDELMSRADAQGFVLAQCVYDLEDQRDLLEEVLQTMLTTAEDWGEAAPNKRHPSQSYYDAFERHEDQLLNTCALIKHPAFAEEAEWRAVSRVSRNLKDRSLKFREGAARLIPYVDFELPTTSEGTLSLDTVFVGPAPEGNIAFSSIDAYLTNRCASPRRGIAASGAPWRSW